MKKIFISLCTFCLMAIMCMAVTDTWAYCILRNTPPNPCYNYRGDNNALDTYLYTRAMVIDRDTTLEYLRVKGTLIIAPGVTVNIVKGGGGFYELNWDSDEPSTVYILGTLNITEDCYFTIRSGNVYVSGALNMTGDYFFTRQSNIYVSGALNVTSNEIVTAGATNYWKTPGATITMNGEDYGTEVQQFDQFSNVQLMDEKIPTFVSHVLDDYPCYDPDKSIGYSGNYFVGWPQYYLKVILTSDPQGYRLEGYYDKACTHPIDNLDDWLESYSNHYRACYNAGLLDGAASVSEPGMNLSVELKNDRVYEFKAKDIESAEFYRVNPE